MERLLLLRALLIVAFWETVPGQDLVVDPVRTQYPVLRENHTLDCDCGGLKCEQVVWFRTLVPDGTLQVLGRYNQADRVTYGPGLEHKVRISKRSGSGYSLRILSTSTTDRGAYSCVIKVRGNREVWRTGVLLLPGESPHTEAPQQTSRAPSLSHCLCETHTQPTEGCGRLILWPLVGLTSFLFVTLLFTLFYFSRLPKKCRHQFVRKK